jgi:hypothetical protein
MEDLRSVRKKLFKLYNNQRSIIDDLTCIACQYANQDKAVLMFEVVIKFMFSSSSIFHINVLYLIDSIIKAKREDYLELFGPHMINFSIKIFSEGGQRNKIQLMKVLKIWENMKIITKEYFDAINVELNKIQNLEILNKINDI